MTEIEKWYAEVNRQFEEDSKTEDFSVPDEWDFDFRAAMKIVKLEEYIARAEQIQSEEQTSAEDKAVRLANIMTKMENQYSIPMLKNETWEQQNQDVIKAYRRISDMREI